MSDDAMFALPSAPVAFKWALSVYLGFWVSIPITVRILIGLMAVDMVTGILAACLGGYVSGEASLRGLVKKTLVLILISAAQVASKPLGMTINVASSLAVLYIVNELISITENCARSGVPIPGDFLFALSRFKSRPRNMTEKEMAEVLRPGHPDYHPDHPGKHHSGNPGGSSIDDPDL